MEFYRSYYSDAADFIDTCNQMLVCIVGVVTSLALIYKINIFMILIIIATCVSEFILLKYIKMEKWKRALKIPEVAFFVKFDYYYSLSKDLTTVKDIRLYGFTDYFLLAITRLISGLEDITSKYMHQNIKVGVARSLLNLVREFIAYAYLTYLVCKGRLSNILNSFKGSHLCRR